jgi:hypothetical protein
MVARAVPSRAEKAGERPCWGPPAIASAKEGQPGPPLCVLGVFPPEADKCERNLDQTFEPTTGEYSHGHYSMIRYVSSSS